MPRPPAVPRRRLPPRVRPAAALQGPIARGRLDRPLLSGVHELRRIRVLGSGKEKSDAFAGLIQSCLLVYVESMSLKSFSKVPRID